MTDTPKQPDHLQLARTALVSIILRNDKCSADDKIATLADDAIQAIEAAIAAWNRRAESKQPDSKEAEQLAKDKWNASADRFNQWDALGGDEKEELIAAHQQPSKVIDRPEVVAYINEKDLNTLLETESEEVILSTFWTVDSVALCRCDAAPNQAARDEILEEAAKVCEEKVKQQCLITGMGTGFGTSATVIAPRTAEQCAAAIRALKDKQNGR